MPETEYHNPVLVLPSDSWLTTCQEQLDRLDIRHPLIITSKGGLRRLDLTTHFAANTIFSEVVPNPTLPACTGAITFSLSRKFDGVVAVGGGSVMDTAKCTMAAMGTDINDVKELIGFNDPYPHRVPGIFIPTTHGTASEVTMWGTIWDMEGQRKHSLSHPDLYPDAAILDPRLTQNLPLAISLSTALDALSHSFEAIWNKHANPTSTEYAITAITMILEHIPGLKEEPGNLAIRERLLTAATTAGLAFSNTRTAAAHSISYPLTIRYGMPHGIAASISILPLLDINGPAIEEPLNTLYHDLRLSDLEQLKARIQAIPQGHLRYRLRDWGIQADHLEDLAVQGFTKGRMENNIIELTPEDVLATLKEIY
ncbi:MAG: phosphonoacetaldehyde reductase [Fidelibacterota bacterium]|nr:MAG: phosphonoacetaldehyde reductase [Candidatus Neomarinimicrobiota bacterium]